MSEARGGQRRTAFVFAGGGSLGAIEVGMLKALVARGVQADLVVGSSVGAVNAAYFAARPDLDGVRRLEQAWRTVRREEVFRIGLFRGLAGLLTGRGHLADPAPLRALLERWIPIRRLEESAIPCVIVATDLLGGNEVTLSAGPVVEALLASAALPGVFPPVTSGGRFLVDGMLSSHTPISAAVSAGASRIIVLPTGHACALTQPPQGALALALHALNLIIAHQIAIGVVRHEKHVDLIVVPPLCPLTVSSHDFSHTEELVGQAETATRRWLEQGGLDIPGVPRSLGPHHHEGMGPRDGIGGMLRGNHVPSKDTPC